MKPTMTIIGYLYSGCNTWLRHHEECDCPPQNLVFETLDQIYLSVYAELVHDELGTFLRMLEKTEDEWNEICGPRAEDRVLNSALEAHMKAAADIVAAQATKERLRSE